MGGNPLPDEDNWSFPDGLLLDGLLMVSDAIAISFENTWAGLSMVSSAIAISFENM